MRACATTLGFILTGVFACQPSPPAPIPATGAAITGTVVERVDGPPYSYLRLKTEQGEVWAAVPMAEVTKGGKVTVKNGAPVKDFTAPGIGKGERGRSQHNQLTCAAFVSSFR